MVLHGMIFYDISSDNDCTKREACDFVVDEQPELPNISLKLPNRLE